MLLNDVKIKYNLTENSLNIYTDGSGGDTFAATGAGIVIEDQETGYSISLPKQCSIFTAEAFAIKSALEIITLKIDNFDNAVIFLDFKSVLQVLGNNKLDVFQNKYILEITRIYYTLKETYRDKKILFIWILSHRGISKNDLADYLAKQGANETASEEIKVPISNFRRYFREELLLDYPL